MSIDPEGAEAPRYALYYAPEPTHALWRFGSELLAYDAAEACDVEPPVISGISREDWLELIADPRQYGFHATLKAPFYLRERQTEQGLLAAVAAFAQTEAGALIDVLEVTAPSSFIALTPVGDQSHLRAFEQRVVEAFEDFRAPLGPADLARRLRAPLSPRQRESLDRYGYPYIGADFQFHMTLTSKLPPEVREKVQPLLSVRFAKAAVAMPLHLDAITVFKQPARARRFEIIARAAFSK